jgi:hypothetical protein
MGICSSMKAQDAGVIHFGVYGRGESNLYKFEARPDKTFSSVRTSNGYSAGIEANAVLHYLLKMDFRLGFSEMNYGPNYRENTTSVLSANNIRSVQIGANAHLRLGSHEKRYPSFFVGTQINTVREKFLSGVGDYKNQAWEETRSFTQLGIAGHFLLKKERVLIKPEMGMRLKLFGRKAWENTPSQVFVGLSVGYRLKK